MQYRKRRGHIRTRTLNVVDFYNLRQQIIQGEDLVRRRILLIFLQNILRKSADPLCRCIQDFFCDLLMEIEGSSLQTTILEFLQGLVESNDASLKDKVLLILRRYLRKDFERELKVDIIGKPKHHSCICHCLAHAFGICSESHIDICPQCERLFSLFEFMKNKLSAEHHEYLDFKLKQLIFWLSHLMRKFYLN